MEFIEKHLKGSVCEFPHYTHKKKIKKIRILFNGSTSHTLWGAALSRTLSEHGILRAAGCPFFVQLNCTFEEIMVLLFHCLPGMLERENMVLKLQNTVQNKRIPILIVSLFFISAIYLVLYREDGEKSGSSSGIFKQNWDSFSSVVKLDPTVEFRNGTDIIWQIPELPKEILFLAHCCDGKAANFWDRSSTCPNCVGLPEERLITLNALARKFAVIAVSSAGACWSFKEERFVVKDVIEWWIAKQKLQNLPLVALGASSGGYFVSILATDVRFSSIVVMIIEGLYDQMDITESYSPTLFVHMPKDKSRMQKLERYMGLLKKKGIDVAEVKCLEFPLSPNLFADRIPSIDVATSSKLFSLFQEKGFIDKNGFMTNDGRD